MHSQSRIHHNLNPPPKKTKNSARTRQHEPQISYTHTQYISKKQRTDAEGFIDRLLESELNWIFVSEKVKRCTHPSIHPPPTHTRTHQSTHPPSPPYSNPPPPPPHQKHHPKQRKTQQDLRLLQREVESGLSGGAVPTLQDDWPLISDVTLSGPDSGDDTGPRPRPPNPVLAAGKAPLRPEGGAGGANRELRAMQLSLDAYVRLLLRRLFYAIPMNVKNIVMGEFRRDLVSLVAERYNEEAKLRSLMSEELWINHKRAQTSERVASLEGVLRKLDQLS